MRILQGKIALVTGGSRGLGKVISATLAEAGATVIVNYAHNTAAAEESVQTITRAGGKALVIQSDITNEEAVQKLVQEVEEKLGGTIDILVNNATGPQPELAIEESSWEDYLDQLNFFVKAPLFLVKAVLPGMKEKGEGRIINIGSEVISLGNPHFSSYVTAKSAQLGMTRSWANELGPSGITVNLLNPGFVPVERHEGIDASGYAKNVPLRRAGLPSDIASTVLFLASDQSKFITGQAIAVNGGNTFGI
ncbi:SDR family NAD(P)-dependent oxidoreductase [Sutcliffiella deserti]|uniref:SDR family NAD(P)-dependent oxidoreductase n=1 Tax=Sutcliffiella deserti TaxID=2875501 RepID=UPI001CBB1CBF|nr:SDR family oxidoreductase [Sutcliffiella deserti]